MPALTHNINDIARCAALYRQDALAPFGLKSCHHSYLIRICNQPGITQDQLARQIFVNKSNIARQLAALEEAGFVERRPAEEDKRAMRVYPTQKALDVLPEVTRILVSWEEAIAADLTAQEKEVLLAALAKMKIRAAAQIGDRDK